MPDRWTELDLEPRGDTVETVKLERFSPFTIVEVEYFYATPRRLPFGIDGQTVVRREVLIFQLDPIQARALVASASPADFDAWPHQVRARFPATELGWRMARKAACV